MSSQIQHRIVDYELDTFEADTHTHELALVSLPITCISYMGHIYNAYYAYSS